VKPKDQKEVNGHDTANDIPFQDRNDEREIDGSRRAGVNGRIQSWDRIERTYGSVSSRP